MALTVLHITDLHFGWDGDDTNERNVRDVCLSGLLTTLSTLSPAWKPNVICLSGDIGWRGAASDYAAARKWLDRLLAACGVGYDRLIVCAGNHDLARAEARKNARPDDPSEADEVLGLPLGNQYIAPFTQFNEFCRRSGIVPLKIAEDESYLVGQRLLDEYRFVCLNSAWFCKGEKDKGKLWLGLPHLRALESAGQLPLVRGRSNVPRTVALVHHPKDWLHPHESNAWERRPNTWDYLAGRCHILLTGHTHAEVRRADRIAEGVLHFTGGSAYAGASHFNSFRLLQLQRDDLSYLSYEFDPRSAENEWKPSKEITLPFDGGGLTADLVPVADRTRWLEAYATKLESSFVAHLSQHEHLDRATAESRFIEVLTREQSRQQQTAEAAEPEARPLSSLAGQPGPPVLVLGGGGSGKTSILRKLAVDCCRSAIVDSLAPLPLFGRLNFFDTHTDVLNGLLDILAREVGLATADVDALWCDRFHRCVFLLDGLNEVRAEFAGDCLLALRRLVEHAQHTYLITSRAGDAATDLRKQITSLREVEVVELDTAQIRTYLERAGAGDLYERLEERLLSLARRPFLLWAISQSCATLSEDELPKNLGQLYENLIDRYMFAVYEESKPKESRPTRYNYQLVKKPITARLALTMCRQGATRCLEDTPTLASIRDDLRELRKANEGIHALVPHEFMPEPFAKPFLDELVANGILLRHGMTLEFMHESVRDYFAATEMVSWSADLVLQNVSALVWRQIEPEYSELPVEGTFVQPLIMSFGLRKDTADLLVALAAHHPLLAAHCMAGAQNIPPEVTDDLLNQWIELLNRQLPRYRWIGCQCLRAAHVRSTELARRLFEVLRSDPAWEVRKSAARALRVIDDAAVTKDLIEHALNEPEDEQWTISRSTVTDAFRYLQTDALIVGLLRIWGDPAESDPRRHHVETIFAAMRRRSVRQAFNRLAVNSDNPRGHGAAIAGLAEAALNVMDSWKSKGILHAEDVGDLADRYAREFEDETIQSIQLMSTWSREAVARALRDPSPPTRAAAARTLAAGRDAPIPLLLDALSHEVHGRISSVLLDALRDVGEPQSICTNWETRLRDTRWTYLFSVPLDFGDDLKKRALSERWMTEFTNRHYELGKDPYVVAGHRKSNGQTWLIRPGSYGGQLYANPVYTIAATDAEFEVFDAGLRPRLIAAAALVGSRGLTVLNDLIEEGDDLLDVAAAEVVSHMPAPDTIPFLSRCLLQTLARGAAEFAVEGLARTGSQLAVRPLINGLTNPWASEVGADIGNAIRVLDGVATLMHFADETGLRGGPDLRLATLAALRGTNEHSAAIEALFMEGAADVDKAVQQEAVRGLGTQPSDRAAARLLDICVADLAAEVREEAANALRRFPGKIPMTKLIAALDSSEKDVQIRAAEALGRIQDDTAIPALARVLETGWPSLQVAAAKALNVLGFSQREIVIPVLCSLARTAPDVPVRRAAADALKDIPEGTDTLYRPIREALTASRNAEAETLIGSNEPFLTDDANLYWWRAFARRSLGRAEQALTDLDKAIGLASCGAVVHRTRAGVLADLNRLPEAVVAAEMAVQADPNEAENHFVLGWISYKAKQLDKAIDATQRCLQLTPSLPGAEFNLGLAFLASGRVPEAMDAYSRGIVLCAELDPERASVLFNDSLQDLDMLMRERPEFQPQIVEAKSRLEGARLQGRRAAHS